MEEERLYPPRFVIRVSGRQATEARNTTINFTGAREDLQTELFLEPVVPQGIKMFTVMTMSHCMFCVHVCLYRLETLLKGHHQCHNYYIPFFYAKYFLIIAVYLV